MARFRSALATATLPLLLGIAPARAEEPPPLRNAPPLEVKLGVLLHDIEHRGHARHNSIDVNFEALSRPLPVARFESRLLQAIAAPRAMLGATVNTEGNTHTVYGGVSWIYTTNSGLFVAPSLGLALHNGNLHSTTRPCTAEEIQRSCSSRKPVGRVETSRDRETLGTRVLLRESLEVGYAFTRHVSVGAYVAHMSNGGWFHAENGGMSFAGVRVGYRFGD